MRLDRFSGPRWLCRPYAKHTHRWEWQALLCLWLDRVVGWKRDR